MSSSIDFTVQARRTGRQAHESGIFANVSITMTVDGAEVVRLSDATLRLNQQDNRYWVGPPFRPFKGADGSNKYSNYWFLFPGKERQDRADWDNYILSKVFEQIPNPEIATEDMGGNGAAPRPAALPTRPPANAAPAQQPYRQPVQQTAPAQTMPSLPQAAPSGPPSGVPRPPSPRPFTPPGGRPQPVVPGGAPPLLQTPDNGDFPA